MAGSGAPGRSSGGPSDALDHEARCRAFVSNISDLILLLGPDGRILYASPPAERVFGDRIHLSPEEALLDFHPDDRAQVVAGLQWLIEHPGDDADAPLMSSIEVRVRTDGLGWRSFEVRGRNLIDAPEIGGILLTLRDITEAEERKAYEVANVELMERVARGVPLVEAFGALSDLRARWLPDAVAALGVVAVDGSVHTLPGAALDAELVELLESVDPASPLGRISQQAEQPVIHRNLAHARAWGQMGRRFAAHGFLAAWIWVLRDEESQMIGGLGLFLREDREPTAAEALLFAQMAHLASIMVQRSRAEATIAHRALHDALTDLPNRSLLVDRIDLALAQAQRNRNDAAVLFCDLDRFKLVNDSLGHPAGDRLLRGVADRWQALLRGGDTVGRFGGDEFVVVANAVDGVAGATSLARRLTDALVEPFAIEGVDVVATVSIGVALASGVRGDTADDLIRSADAAMYEAKRRGAGWAVYDGTARDSVGRLQLEADLRRGIPGDELVVHYQPIVRPADGTVVAVEALVRWNRPGHGLVLPAEFVEVAEQTGMIAPIGSWVLREVVQQAATWSSDPVLRGLQISTNLSARHLAQPGLVAEVGALLDEFGVQPARLALEVTESALADDPAVVAEVIGELVKIGVQVALDDFGTGFTSMEYARRFATMSTLKIDRAFVADLERPDSNADAVIAAIVVLGHGLDALVVGEGVETPDQLGRLCQLGCDLVQGYLFGRPVPAGELASLVGTIATSPGLTSARTSVR